MRRPPGPVGLYNPILEPPPMTAEEKSRALHPSNRAKLFQDARTAIFEHVHTLKEATKGTKSPAVLRVGLEALQNCPVPTPTEISDGGEKSRLAVARSRVAVTVISLVEDQCRSCSTTPKMQNASGAIVREFWGVLSGWFEFFFLTGTRCFLFLRLGPATVMKSPAISLMSIMKSLENSDHDLRTIPGTLTIFIQAWNCRDEDGTPIVFTEGAFHQGFCPMLAMVANACLNRPDVRDQLVHEMLVNKKLPIDTLVDTVIGRIIKVRDFYLYEELKADWFVPYVHRIIDFTLELCNGNRMVQSAFLNVNFLSQFAGALHQAAVDPQCNLDMAGWEMLSQALSTLTVWVIHHSSKIMSNMRDLIKGELLEASLKALSHIPGWHPLFQHLIYHVDLLSAYASHPPILKVLAPRINDILTASGEVPSVAAKKPRAARAINGLAASYRQNLSCVNGRWAQLKKERKFCDNMEHHQIHGFSRTHTKTMACSFCLSVVYCSSECQRMDWKVYHRDECRLAAAEYYERKDRVWRIPHVQRNYYVTLLEDLASKSSALFLHLDANHIPIFDTTVFPYDIKTARLIDYKRATNFKHWGSRVDAFLDECASSHSDSKGRSQYLIAGRFYHGKERVHALVRVRYCPEAERNAGLELIDDDEPWADPSPFQAIGMLIHSQSVDDDPLLRKSDGIWSLNKNHESAVKNGPDPAQPTERVLEVLG